MNKGMKLLLLVTTCGGLTYHTFSGNSWTGPWQLVYSCLEQWEQDMETLHVIPILSTLLQTTNSYLLVYQNILDSGIQHHHKHHNVD